jgi:hypothetical protein
MIVGIGLCFHFRFLIVPEGLILNSERNIGSGDRLELLDLLLTASRKMVWDLISTHHLVCGWRSNSTSSNQSDYDHYDGRAESVSTTIINMMKNDRRNGTVFPV